MPMFYFDVNDGELLQRDDIGSEFADERAARQEATCTLAEMAKSYVPCAMQHRDITMWVRNEVGEAICQVAMTFAVRDVPRG